MNRPEATPRETLPDALLERYLHGELPADRLEVLRKRLAEDPIAAARLESLRQSDRDILTAYPSLDNLPRRAPAAVPGARTPAARRVRPPSAPETPGILDRLFPGGPWLKTAVPAFAALAILVAVVERRHFGFSGQAGSEGNPDMTETATEPGIRLKGLEAGLAIYRKSASGPELLPPRSVARPGDTLQIFYQSFQDLHGIIFSVDGRGAVTLHLPEEAGPAVRLVKGGLHPLPHAYLLDQAPTLERFFLVTAPLPFGADSLVAVLRPSLLANRPLADSLEGLPAGFRQYAYTLHKEDPAKGAPKSKSSKGVR